MNSALFCVTASRPHFSLPFPAPGPSRAREWLVGVRSVSHTRSTHIVVKDTYTTTFSLLLSPSFFHSSPLSLSLTHVYTHTLPLPLFHTQTPLSLSSTPAHSLFGSHVLTLGHTGENPVNPFLNPDRGRLAPRASCRFPAFPLSTLKPVPPPSTFL